MMQQHLVCTGRAWRRPCKGLVVPVVLIRCAPTVSVSLPSVRLFTTFCQGTLALAVGPLHSSSHSPAYQRRDWHTRSTGSSPTMQRMAIGPAAHVQAPVMVVPFNTLLPWPVPPSPLFSDASVPLLHCQCDITPSLGSGLPGRPQAESCDGGAASGSSSRRPHW